MGKPIWGQLSQRPGVGPVSRSRRPPVLPLTGPAARGSHHCIVTGVSGLVSVNCQAG